MKIINPATGEVIAEMAEDTDATLAQKLNALQNGAIAWRSVPLADRVSVIQRFSLLLHEHEERLAGVLTDEMGKPLQQSKNELTGARNRISWLAGNASRYLSDEEMSSGDTLKEVIVYEPLGIVCNISAWNYPYLVGVNVFIPALLAGNSVMYKPSEYATMTGIEISRLLRQAGLPEDVFQLAIGSGDIGRKLLDLPFDGYFFTGSYATGKRIYEHIAPRMIPCQCELGGKDPLYVTNDVLDLRAVVAATADGAFYNNGQSCCAVERIYVHADIYDEYVRAFVEEVRGYRVGDPREDGVYIGPLARKQQIDFLNAQIRDACAKGAKVLTGGEALAGRGFYFSPTVVVDVTHEMELMREESFGPVIGIMKVSSDEEAVKLMKDTAYGLTASVYSATEERARRILDQLNTGSGYWNCCDRVSPALPWSGRKNSGFGATLSHAGLRVFTRPRGFHLKTTV